MFIPILPHNIKYYMIGHTIKVHRLLIEIILNPSHVGLQGLYWLKCDVDLLPLILQYERYMVYSTHQYEYLLIHKTTDSNTQASGYSMFDFGA